MLHGKRQLHLRGFNMKHAFIIILAIIVAVSCSPVSKELMRQVDQTLTLKEVRKSADQYKGKTVLWGGIIIETRPRPDETMIIMMQTALDYEKRPMNLDYSEGRFMVKQKGFLDPAIYTEGREITVTGNISGKEELPLGEIQYVYPVITATQLILWEKRYHFPSYYDPWYWDRYPSWWHYPYYRYHPFYLP